MNKVWVSVYQELECREGVALEAQAERLVQMFAGEWEGGI